MSNDNPFSEAAFKTLKYCPAFPDHFDDIDHAGARGGWGGQEIVYWELDHSISDPPGRASGAEACYSGGSVKTKGSSALYTPRIRRRCARPWAPDRKEARRQWDRPT